MSITNSSIYFKDMNHTGLNDTVLNYGYRDIEKRADYCNMTDNGNANGTDHDLYTVNLTAHAHDTRNDAAEWIVQNCELYVIPVVLCVGILGNCLCIIGLRHLRQRLPLVEQQDACGLLCLAISDLGFCLVGVLSFLFQQTTSHRVLAYYFDNYRAPMLNLFILSSTWLIIVIALSRLKVIGDPLKTRKHACVTQRSWIYCAVFVFSIIFTLPQFFHFWIVQGPCLSNCYCFYRVQLFPHFLWYHVAWHFCGTILPCGLLVYANCALIHKINRSMRRNSSKRCSKSMITVILVLMISLFILLVLPSMIMTLLILKLDLTPLLRVATSVTNFMQSVYFACNFVLYLTISRKFRDSLLTSLCCLGASRTHRNSRYKYEMEMIQKESN